MKGKSLQKTIAVVMAITIIGKLLGFGREVFLSYFMGTSGISDAYLISLTIPGTIFQFVGTGLSTCFIPVYIRVMQSRGDEASKKFTDKILSLILLFTLATVILIIAFCNQIVYVFASGFKGETFKLAVLFTRISACSLFSSVFVYVYNSLLQSYNDFILASFAGIPNSIIVIVFIVLAAKVNVYFLPFGSLISIFVQMCTLIPAIRKHGYKPHLTIHFWTDDVKEMMRLFLPVIVGVAVNQINVLIDKSIASGVSVGGISALNYANSLIMFVQGLFGETIATVYYPSITRYVQTKETKHVNETVTEAISGMLILLVPITVGCILLAGDAVKVLYGRGAFNVESVSMTSVVLIGYGIGIIGYGLREILSRVFYAMHKTFIPTVNACIGVGINITLNITLSRVIGIAGLALATSISSIITSSLLYIELKRKKLFKETVGAGVQYLKMIASAIIMGVCIVLVNKSGIIRNVYARFLTEFIVGVFIYFGMCIFLKVEMAEKTIRNVLGRIKKH